LNWADKGTCWAAMLFKSVWIAAWLIDGVNTHTFGPKVAVTASGHRLVVVLEAELAAAADGDEPTTAALAGTAASAPATSAAAIMSGRTLRCMRTSLCW
jgi:hypothetical protein